VIVAAQTPQLNVLICEPGAPTGTLFLPYMWAVLKSYHERHGAHVDAINWLDPLFDRERVLGQIDDLRGVKIDVVGLSCYTWNSQLNLRLARAVKESNPKALVVAGGPDPDYKDPDFFRKHPEIDAVVIKDGEVPFTRILDGLAGGTLDLAAIPGLCLPSPSPSLPLVVETGCASHPPHLFTGNAELPVAFDHSPYRLQVDRLRGMMVGCEDHVVGALFETNRGCPYSCNYCDWGSATMSKVRKFDQGRIEADLETLAGLRVNWLYWADANVGILPRDVDIADLIVTMRRKTGFPGSMIYASAKNNPDRTVDIVRRLYDGGVVPGHWLAVQHTDDEVLKTADRSNISAEKYREVATSLRRRGIPVYPQFILGMPGDTLEKWKTCVTTVIEWGMHEDFWIPIYSVLPNAPVADPKFLREWQVETLDRELIEPWGLRHNGAHEVIRSRIIVAFKGFSRDDWVEASVYSSLIRGMHNLAITRLPAVYLHATHGVPYREIYDALIDEFLGRHPTWRVFPERLRAVYRRVLADADAVDDYPIADFPDLPWYVNPPKGVFIEIAMRRDAFMDDLKQFLERRFPRARETGSVVDYQRHLVLSPDRDPGSPRNVRIGHDWPAYFAAVEQADSGDRVPAPRRFVIPRTATVPPHSARMGNDEADPRRAWVRHILSQSNSGSTSNHPHPNLAAARFFWPVPAVRT
jgi:putative methyltransferase